MEPLVSLIYCSEISDGPERDGIAATDLLEKARANNRMHGISGIICFDSRYVLQCIEGGRRAINALYGRLVADERHSRVTLLDYRQVARRSFREWSMAYIPADKVGRDLNLMYSAGDEFDPFQFSGEGAYLFVQEVGSLAGTVDEG